MLRIRDDLPVAMALVTLYVVFKPYLPRLPFKDGDLVQQGSIFGNVASVPFTHPLIRPAEGNTAVVPNHRVLNDPLINYTTFPNRRSDVDFSISYEEDVDAVRRAVEELLRQDARVLDEPPPVLAVAGMAPSYREMRARFWLRAEGFIGNSFAITEAIDRVLDEQGVQRGVPRIDVVSGNRPTLDD